MIAFKKNVKIFWCATLSMIILISLAWGGLAWKLSQSPISLDFLRPRLISFVSTNFPNHELTFEDITLEWDRQKQGYTAPFEIHLRQVKLKKQTSDVLIADQISINPDWLSLFIGSMRPKEIRLFNPIINYSLTSQAQTQQGQGQGQDQQNFLDDLRKNNGKILSTKILLTLENFQKLVRKTRIKIMNGHARLENTTTQSTWEFSKINTTLKMGTHVKGGGEFSCHKIDSQGTKGPSHAISFAFKQTGKILFTQIDHNLINIQEIAKHYNFLSPFSGEISVHTQLKLNEETGFLDWRGELKSPTLSLALDNQGAGPLKFESLSIPFIASKGLSNIHFLPTQIQSNLGVFNIDAKTLISDTLIIPITLDIPQGNTEQILKLWPDNFKIQLRNDIRRYLKSGTMKDTQVSFSLTIDGKNNLLPVKDFTLDADFSEVVVPSIRSLPELTDIEGSISIQPSDCELILTQGHMLKNTQLTYGNIFFSDLPLETRTFSLDLFLEGPLANLITTISTPEINYSSKTGLRLQKALGKTATAIHIEGPLKRNKAPTDLQLVVTSAISDSSFTLEKLSKENRADSSTLIKKADFQIRHSSERFDLNGTFLTPFIDMTLELHRFYDPKAPEQLRVSAKGNLGNGAIKEGGISHILNMAQKAPFTLDGVALQGKEGRFEFKADLTPASLEIAQLGWKKKVGQKGEARFVGIFKDGKLTNLQDVFIKGPNLHMVGNGSFAPLNINLSTFRIGDNDLKVKLKDLGANGWKIDLQGETLDLHAMESLKGDIHKNDVESSQSTGIDATLNLRHILLPGDKKLGRTTGTFVKQGQYVRRVKLELGMPDGSSSFISLIPNKNSQALKIVTDDLGELMNLTRIYSGMEGGEATLIASRPLTKSGIPSADGFTGTLEANGFRLIKTPGVTKFLTLTSIRGALDTLRGKEILFDTGRVTFEGDENHMHLSKGLIAGAGMGITFKGTINKETDQLNLTGAVIPLYMINSIISKIPILGHIIAGIKQDGGLLAVSFAITGHASSPDISANPLSALTPGILKDMFKGED